MHTIQHSQWGPRIVTFLLWLAAAASLAFWGLQWSATGAKTPAASLAGSDDPAPTDSQALARLLGAPGAAMPVLAAPSAASRYALTGVVAGAKGGGTALISVDGKAARPFEVGDMVDAPLLLQSVASRQATLAAGVDAPAAVTLELPPVKRLAAPAGVEPAQAVKANPFEGNPFKPSLGG